MADKPRFTLTGGKMPKVPEWATRFEIVLRREASPSVAYKRFVFSPLSRIHGMRWMQAGLPHDIIAVRFLP
jgi:hypothetical protein